jgi:hypothetical protein
MDEYMKHIKDMDEYIALPSEEVQGKLELEGILYSLYYFHCLHQFSRLGDQSVYIAFGILRSGTITSPFHLISENFANYNR